MRRGPRSPESVSTGRSPRDVDPVRMAAFGILMRLESRRGSIEGALRAAASSFEDRDRRFLWTLVQETIRWKARLDALLAPLLHRPLAKLDPPVRVLLRMAATQACLLDQIPAHAIVDEGVRLAAKMARPGAEKMVNAVSRRLIADGPVRWAHLAPGEDPASWPVGTSHPSWLVARWRSRWGNADAFASLLWDNTRAPVWLRAAPGAPPPAGGQPGWVPGTYRMSEEYRPAEDPLFQEGAYTAQDPSEALVGLLPPAPSDAGAGADDGAEDGADDGAPILDLCAAPGTKTTHLSSRFGARVVAMDRTRNRAQRLRETLARTRLACPILIGDASRPPLRPSSAAGVLLDAPCSALGVLRRRVDARWNVREEDLRRLAKQQEGMLLAAANLVAPGGWLLYSVCSTEPEETEQVRASFLGGSGLFEPLPFALDLPDEVRPSTGVLRIRPGQAECDGVFACLFRKTGGR
ncbi:MAG: RsmB/NOP family class I SAM-dependent RNA methyltransferase [Candidatus Eisenbacteria bacterium]